MRLARLLSSESPLFQDLQNLASAHPDRAHNSRISGEDLRRRACVCVCVCVFVCVCACVRACVCVTCIHIHVQRLGGPAPFLDLEPRRGLAPWLRTETAGGRQPVGFADANEDSSSACSRLDGRRTPKDLVELVASWARQVRRASARRTQKVSINPNGSVISPRSRSVFRDLQ